jgi:hypothetical protein
MDICCSCDGHRRVHRQISWDVVVIVEGEEVTILPVGEVGTRGARGKKGTATEDTNKVVLECLDGFFSHVASMFVWGNKFICHVGVADGFLAHC